MRYRLWRLMAIGVMLGGAMAPPRASCAEAGKLILPPPNSESKSRDPVATQTATGRPAGTSSSRWSTTVGALLFVVALVFVLAKVFRKSLPTRSFSLPEHVVQVLGRRSLDYRHTLHLVRCGSRLLLLASSAEGLRALTEIDDPAEVEQLVDECQRAHAGKLATSVERDTASGIDDSPASAADSVAKARPPGIDHTALRLSQPHTWASRQTTGDSSADNAEAAA